MEKRLGWIGAPELSGVVQVTDMIAENRFGTLLAYSPRIMAVAGEDLVQPMFTATLLEPAKFDDARYDRTPRAAVFVTENDGESFQDGAMMGQGKMNARI